MDKTEKRYRLVMTSAGGGSWSTAIPTTLLEAHRQLQHMITCWQDCGTEIASFEVFEICAKCSGGGTLTTKRRNPTTYRYEKPCDACKGKNCEVQILDWRRLDDFLASSRQVSRRLEREEQIAADYRAIG
jgi:hypothetical protein